MNAILHLEDTLPFHILIQWQVTQFDIARKWQSPVKSANFSALGVKRHIFLWSRDNQSTACSETCTLLPMSTDLPYRTHFFSSRQGTRDILHRELGKLSLPRTPLSTWTNGSFRPIDAESRSSPRQPAMSQWLTLVTADW